MVSTKWSVTADRFFVTDPISYTEDPISSSSIQLIRSIDLKLLFETINDKKIKFRTIKEK